MHSWCIASVLILMMGLPSCATTKSAKPEEKPKKTEVTAPRLVGRIASIPAGQKFVLIQSYGKWEVPASSILTTSGSDERVANLLATGENLGQYAAADIQSGSVEVGDAVYFRPPVKTPEAAETDTSQQPTETQNPQPGDNPSQGNVQKNN